MYTFNQSKYIEILELFKRNNFEICRFDGIKKNNSGKKLILRHDVDFSLEYALEMAEVEKRIGVSSTYFVMLYSDHYTVFNAEARQLLLQIQSLGHEIGLHYESSMWGDIKADYTAKFCEDLRLLEKLIGVRVTSAAQHNPIDSDYFNIEEFVEFEAYSEKIRTTYAYISDSAMTWRGKTPELFLHENTHIQFLAHPIWWMTSSNTSFEKLEEWSKMNEVRREVALDKFKKYLQKCLDNRVELDRQFKGKRS